MTKDIDLKPCPFCAGSATFVQMSAGMPRTFGYDSWHGVRCKACDAMIGDSSRRFRSKDEASAAWNRRADTRAQTDAGKSAEVAKWTDGLPDNLEAAALDSLLWLQYTQARSKLLGMSVKDWGRLDDCIEALQGFLPQPGERTTEGGKP